MTIFYSWTFLQLLNMINLKTNDLKEEKAILFIAGFEDTSRYQRILDYLNRERIFDNIYYLSISQLTGEQKIFKTKKINDYLKSIIPKNEPINGLVIAGFWCDALLLIRTLDLCYGLKSIFLIEEGIESINIKGVFKKLDIKHRVYYGGIFYKRYLDYVKGIYAYMIFDNCGFKNAKYKCLHQINSNNTVCYNLLSYNKDRIKNYIEKYTVFYFDSNLPVNDLNNLHAFYNELFAPFLKAGERISIRLHPSSSIRSELFNREGLEIDIEKRTVEELAMAADWEKKIIISINSSSAVNMGRIFGVYPYIIYINMLYSDSVVLKPPVIADEEKVFIPRSMQEYNNIVKRILEVL